MPTSENPDFAYTAAELCLSAARELGAVGMGDSLEDSEQEEMLFRLNGMLGKWAVDGALFREVVGTILIAAGTGAATLPTEIRDIRSVRHQISATNKRMLWPWNRDQYYAMPNRAQTGNPTVYYYSQQVGGDVLRVWPVPTAEITLELDYNRAFYIVENPDEEIDIPADWYEAALYGLAARSANIFGATRVDPSTVQRIDNQSRVTYERMLDADRPDSYSFEYDSPIEAR